MKIVNINKKVIIGLIVFLAAILFQTSISYGIKWIDIPSSGDTEIEKKTGNAFGEANLISAIGNMIEGAFKKENGTDNTKFYLVQDKYVYCMQENAETYYQAKAYTVKASMKIVGCDMEFYDSTSKETGKPAKHYTGTEFAKLAYLLSDTTIGPYGFSEGSYYDSGYVRRTDRQWVVWYWLNQFGLNNASLKRYSNGNDLDEIERHAAERASEATDKYEWAQAYLDRLVLGANDLQGVYIWILESDSSHQRFMISKPFRLASLTIKKEDASTKTLLKGAEFKIQDEKTKKFIGENGFSYQRFDPNKNTWVEQSAFYYLHNCTWNNAKEYKITDSSKGLKISGLDSTTKYTIWEVTAPEGYSLYDQPGYVSQDGEVRNAVKVLEHVSFGENDPLENKQYQNTATNNVIKTVIAKNDHDFGSIHVMKYDEETKKSLANMGFSVQIKGEGWLSGTPGSYSYKNSFDNKGIYYTNKNGEYLLEKLPLDKRYRVWEVKSPNEDVYPLEQQKNYDKSQGAVNLTGEDFIYLDLKPIEVYAENKKGDADLSIIKYEKGNTNKKLNITFKIETKEIANKTNVGWLSGTSKSYEYGNTYDEAQKYKTEDGERTLKKLSTKYQYRIWEIVSPDPDNYELSQQPNYQKGKGACLTEEWITLNAGSTNENKIELPNTPTVGKLIVNKVDKDDNTKKLDFEFKIQFKKDDTVGWLSGKSGSYSYKNTDYEKATTFKTKNGTLTLNNLSTAYQYIVWETKSPDPDNYALSEQMKYKKGVGVQLSLWLTLENDKEVSLNAKNTFTVGNLEVNKVDKDESTKKLDMKFKIQYINKETQKEGWLTEKNGSYGYKNSSYSKATTFETKDGTRTLNNLSTAYKYKIWETESSDPIQYPLDRQPEFNSNYEYDSRYGLLISGKDYFSLDRLKKVTKNATNKNVPISISGFVWVDCGSKGVENSYDNVYNSEKDVTLKGIKVTLFEKNTENKAVDEVYTDENGRYTFKEKVKYEELDNYYVEFDYTNRTIKEKNGETKSSDYYIPVVYNSKNLNEIKTNGSRALATWMHGNDDANYLKNKTRQARTYRGKDSNYLKVYGLKAIASKLYNSGNRTLESINLGIRKIHDPDYSIAEDLKYVIIKINNYQYTYEYGKRTIDSNAEVPKIKVENKELGMYTKPISPTDIYHLQKNPTNGIEVYVIYNIMIKNSEVQNDQNLYKEEELHVTSLTNTFSTERYELNTNSILNKEGVSAEINSDIGNWNEKAGEKGKATYEKKNEKEIVVKPNMMAEKYIQFKVKPDEIQRILNIPEDQKVIVDDKGTEGLKETTPPTAKTIGYHIYSRNEYAWENIPNIPKTIDRKSISKEKQDEAPYLIFTLGEERKISGLIFEDSVDMTERKEGEVLGNGKYDNNEKKVEKVGAVLVNSDGTVVKRYVKGEDNTAKEVDDVVYSNSDGTYIITGITPGDYYLKFIYGKFDDQGHEIISKIGDTTVDAKEYKSTIITAEWIRDALKNELAGKEYNYEWYKIPENNSTYSVAADNFDERIKVNKNELTSISAKSPQIDITIENTEKTEKTMDDSLNSQYSFGGFYFGIIKQPEQKVQTQKKITNVKLVNSPNIIFDVNPGTEKALGVTDLDGVDENEGSTYTRIEIEKDSIYGSGFEITYEITVENKSDINYYETDDKYQGWYYLYGEHDESYSREYEIDLEEVTDLYDPVLKYVDKEEGEDKKIKVKSIGNSNETIKVLKDGRNEFKGKEFKEALIIEGWEEFAREGKASRKVTFEKMLSAENDDLDYINGAMVSKAKIKEDENATMSYLYAKPVDLGNPAYAESVASVPTGDFGQYASRIVIISLIGLLGIVAIGLSIIIKKSRPKINYLR